MLREWTTFNIGALRNQRKSSPAMEKWWWCPKNKMDGKFYGIQITQLPNKHDDWAEEKHKNIAS